MPKEVSPGEREMAQSRALRPQRASRPKILPFPLAVKQTEAQRGEETCLFKVTQPMGCKAGHASPGLVVFRGPRLPPVFSFTTQTAGRCSLHLSDRCQCHIARKGQNWNSVPLPQQASL